MVRHALFLVAVWLATAAAASAAVRWADLPKQSAEWAASADARAVADSVLSYQTDSGGWPKNTDLATPPTAAQRADQTMHEATIDNDGTTTPLHFLARIITTQPDARYRAAFERGLDYLFAAQYPNGGWPQFYPLKPGYYTHITYNDNAMVNVLTLLRAVAAGREPYTFVDAARRNRAAAAVAQGRECILRTQVKQDGKLTVWCAQHDEATFAPAAARNFEPVSLSGSESVGIVKWLMGEATPTPEIITAIEGAVHWFESVPVHGLRLDDSPGPDGKKERRTLADPAAPALWARFYELGTNRPIYTGRDKVIRYDYNEIERERRTGYGYLGDWPASLLAKDYPRWRAKHQLP